VKIVLARRGALKQWRLPLETGLFEGLDQDARGGPAQVGDHENPSRRRASQLPSLLAKAGFRLPSFIAGVRVNLGRE